MTLLESNTIGARASTSHLFYCWRCKSLPLIVIVLCVLLLPFAQTLPCTRDEHWASYTSSVQDSVGHDDGCASNDVGISLLNDGRSSPDCASLKHVCARSDSFCFPSTLPGVIDGQNKCRSSFLGASGDPFEIGDANFRWLSDNTVYRLSNRKKVTCSMMNADGVIDVLSPKNENINQDDVNLCGGPLPPNAWMRESSGMTIPTNQNSMQIESSLIDTSLSPHMEINPTLLDWGLRSLYSPSCTFLTVANTHNDSILHVYEPFSTDPQFYLRDFQELSIPPEKSASISFIFLPRWLGSSSAQIVLQTSYGGFIIHAKGRAIESSYRIQPLVEFDVSENGRLHKNLSLYNPFDEVLYVEEVAVLVSIVSGNMSHSSHVVCRADAIQQSFEKISSFVSNNEHSHVKRSEYGPSFVGIRPQRKWEVSPHDVGAVLEVSLLPHVEGNVSGVICMKLQSPSQDKIETVMVPFEAKMQHKVVYYALAGSVSVFLEPLVTYGGKDSIYLLSLRNGGSSLLRLVKVNEIIDSKKFFNIRYTEGLLLYPETLTQIAFITDSSTTDSWGMTHEVPCENLNCMLQIVTNESSHPQIEIPCHDLVYACSRHEHSSLPVASKDSSIGLKIEHEESASDRTIPSGGIPKENLFKQSNVLEVAEADELILRNWKYQGSMIEMSVLDDHELLFPLVEVGTWCSKWISVKNPSQKPVMMQLLLSSGSVVDQCKSAADFSEHVMSRFARISSIETLDGFSVGKSAIVEALVHPSGRAAFGPIIFHPSDRCMWRSSALIRNNLSGVEWLPLQGVGGSHSLVLLEDTKPVQKLEFNVDWSMPLNISSPESIFHTEQTSATCGNLLSKELFVKNTGELALEVLKLEVSGASCWLDGFRIHTCKAFALAPGESTKLHISYQSDFSADVIHRDLELALASGIIVIPMKANIPIYMMKICRKSFIWSLVKMIPLVIFVAFSITALLFCFLLPTFPSTSEDFTIKSNSTIATITKVGKARMHQNPRTARSDREDAKPKASKVSRYSECSSNKQNNTQNIESKQSFDYQEKAPLLHLCSEAKSAGEPGRSSVPETSQIGDLTVRIVREKGRRRSKRRASRTAGLATKLEASSSQSGNSTPSSPLSPNALTPKQVWPLSPETLNNRVAAVRNQEKQRAAGSSSDATHEPVSINCRHNTWEPVVAHEWPSVTSKPTVKPVLLPSASFPASGWRAPGVAAPQQFLAATSPIAPHARAPGSRLAKDNVVKRDEETFHGKEFTYDIWGNHLADHIMGRSKELSPRPFSDASEGDSLSFFARGPQSLVKMSSARSVSPGPNPLAYDVNCNNQMV